MPVRKEIGLFGCAPWGGWGGSCGSGARKLPARGKLEQRFLLRGQFDRQFDLTQPGTFHVKASRHVRVYGEGYNDVLADIDAQNEFDIVLREPEEGELEAAYQRFVTDLRSADSGTQGIAASAVTQNPPQFLENVILSLASTPQTIGQSIDGLKHLSTPAARAKLIEIASGEDESLRQQAIPALGEIANSEDCDAMLRIAARSEQYTHAQAYIAAGRICRQKAVPALAALLPSADQQLAMAVATGLGNTASRQAVPTLIGLLISSDAFIQREAIGALFTLTHHGKQPESNDPIDASQAYSAWRSWWAMNSQTAVIYGPDQCPTTSRDR